jgi:hypothetical protein
MKEISIEERNAAMIVITRMLSKAKNCGLVMLTNNIPDIRDTMERLKMV